MPDPSDADLPQQRHKQLRPTVAAAALLLGALALSVFGFLAATAHYDGMVSLLNPLACLSCLSACMLITLAPFVLSAVYKAGRRQ